MKAEKKCVNYEEILMREIDKQEKKTHAISNSNELIYNDSSKKTVKKTVK